MSGGRNPLVVALGWAALCMGVNAMAEMPRQLENDFVAAAREQLAPDQEMTVGGGALGAVTIWLSGGTLTLARGEEAPQPIRVEPGSYLHWPPAEIGVVRNLGRTPLDLVTARVKALTGIAAPDGSLAAVPLHELQAQDERLGVTFAATAETGMHYHPRKGFAVITRPGTLRSTLPDGTQTDTALAAGQMFWHEEELRHQLQNTGDTTLQVVDLEWK